MIWLARPPYLRWLAAAGLVIAAATFDLAGRATEPIPYAATSIPRGASLATAAVEWRDVPVGTLEFARDLDGYTTVGVAAGDPIMAANVSPHSPIPAGWWSLPVDLPGSVAQGQEVRMVGTNPEFHVDGIVAQLGDQSTFGIAEPGLVAVPGEFADRAARAQARGQLVVLLGH